MEVRPGYKKTEMGVIPEEWDVDYIEDVALVATGQTRLPGFHGEWEVKTLGDLFNFSGGYSASRSQLSTEGHCYLHYGDIHGATKTCVDARADYQDIPKLNIPLKRVSPGSLLKDGDVVFVDASEDDEGTSKHVVVVNKDSVPFISGLHTIVAKSKTNELVHEYRRYCFQTAAVRQQFLFYAVGKKVSGISKTNIPKLTLPVPSVPEQRAIATALSDVDALLGGLDRLIAKKRDLKQAAMQQLLTGQTRLPGFHGEWEAKTLGKLFDLSAGKSKTAFVTDEGDYWVCDMGSVSTEGKLVVSKRTNYRGDFLEEGDLVMPKDDIGGGKIIGKVGYVDANGLYVLGDHVYRLCAREGDSRFVAYMINSHRINSELRRKVIGSAQLGLGRRSVEEQEVIVPQPAEQTAIADLLSDMDAELAALEAWRDKTRDLKQAMMQELLTGKTRLVPAGAAHA